MPVSDILIVGLIVSAFCLFGCVLAWASWDESRHARQGHG